MHPRRGCQHDSDGDGDGDNDDGNGTGNGTGNGNGQQRGSGDSVEDRGQVQDSGQGRRGACKGKALLDAGRGRYTATGSRRRCSQPPRACGHKVVLRLTTGALAGRQLNSHARTRWMLVSRQHDTRRATHCPLGTHHAPCTTHHAPLD